MLRRRKLPSVIDISLLRVLLLTVSVSNSQSWAGRTRERTTWTRLAKSRSVTSDPAAASTTSVRRSSRANALKSTAFAGIGGDPASDEFSHTMGDRLSRPLGPEFRQAQVPRLPQLSRRCGAGCISPL